MPWQEGDRKTEACVAKSMALTSTLLHAAAKREPYVAVLNCGCSGAHQPDLIVGEVVVATHVVPLDAHLVTASGEMEPMGVRPTMQVLLGEIKPSSSLAFFHRLLSPPFLTALTFSQVRRERADARRAPAPPALPR